LPQIGVEFQEIAYTLSAKNDRKISEGMTFNVNVGVSGLTAGSDKKEFAIMLADTVIVKAGGAEVVTAKADKEMEKVTTNDSESVGTMNNLLQKQFSHCMFSTLPD
jgi:nucleosome binding factor SPN SPT16 subunit